ncbi:MAG: hypothetical protein PUC37_01110 [Spirochaetales bacterium]|nr:hypothetical protein [Spirochaetales bacterium]
MYIKLKGYTFLDYCDFSFSSSGLSRKVRFTSLFLIILVFLAFFTDYFFHLHFFDLLRTEIKVLSVIGILILIYFFIILFQIFRAYKSLKYFNIETELEITEDKILEKSKFTRLEIPKNKLSKIILSKNRIYIFYQDFRAILICKKSLENENKWNELKSFIFQNYDCNNFVIKKM